MSNQTSSLELSHFPVMLNEVIKILTPSSNKKIIYCTFGAGGYSREILKVSNNQVYAIDRDKIHVENGFKQEILRMPG